MNDIPKVYTWRGERIEEMSHEALLEAFKELGDMYAEATERHVRDWSTLQALRHR